MRNQLLHQPLQMTIRQLSQAQFRNGQAAIQFRIHKLFLHRIFQNHHVLLHRKHCWPPQLQGATQPMIAMILTMPGLRMFAVVSGMRLLKTMMHQPHQTMMHRMHQPHQTVMHTLRELRVNCWRQKQNVLSSRVAGRHVLHYPLLVCGLQVSVQ